ncbi:MAG: hypothetical protein AAGA31_18510, partial [Bacteroidota bacterium]
MLFKKLLDRDYQTLFWQHFLLFISLLGILPGVRDYSLYFIDLDYPEQFNFLFGIAMLLGLLVLPLAVYVAYRRRDFWQMLAFLPLVLVFLQLISGDLAVGAPLAWSMRYAFVHFLIRGSLRSWPFLAFLALVGLSQSFLQFALLGGIALLLRSLVYLVKQNLPTLGRMGWKKMVFGTLRSLLLWSPMLLVIIPSLKLSEYLENKAVEVIYANSFLDRHTTPMNFEADLDQSLDSLIIRMKIQAHYQVDSVREVSGDVRENMPPTTGKLIRNSIVPPKKTVVDFDCAWWRLDCHAAEGAGQAAANATSEAFKETGKKLASNTEKQLSGFLRVGDDSLNLQLDLLDGEIDRQLDQTRSAIQKVTLNSYRVLLLILLILDLGFFFVVIKSFTYVLARVLFSQKEGTFISLREQDEKMPRGQITATGNTYHLKAGAGPDFFVNRRYEPAGRAPKMCFPQWYTGIVPRLLSGSWSMNRVVMEADRSAVNFNAAVGIEFVEWELAAGESVVFSYRDFV